MRLKRFSREQGREVFAVPGPMTAVTSQGTHHLLKQGARLVTCVEDILEELRLTPVPSTQPSARGEPPAQLPEREQCVLACVSRSTSMRSLHTAAWACRSFPLSYCNWN